MIELALFALSIGALGYQTIQLSISLISIVSVFVCLAWCISIPTFRGCILGIIFAVCIIIGGITAWRFDTTQPSSFFGTRTIEGKIYSIDRRLEKTVVLIREEYSRVLLQASFPIDPVVLPGDRVRITGTISKPESFITDTGRTFQYESYLLSKGIVGIIEMPYLVKTAEGKVGLLRSATIIRHAIAAVYTNHISFPIDGIISGMLVGYQGGLSEKVNTLFRDTGVLHVLVLSGFNITLLAGTIGILLASLPASLRVVITILCIILIVCISGAGIAALRAGSMGVVSLVTKLRLKNYNPLRTLFLTYGAFLLLSPYTIFYDPGFHLSFLATFFMIAVLPKITPWVSFIPETKQVNVRELLLLACIVPVFMLPYTMYFSGSAPLAGIVANILLALISPILMILGVVLFCLSFLPPIADMIGILISWIGEQVLLLLELFAQLPTWNTSPLSWWGVLGSYGVLLVLLFRSELMFYVQHLRNVLQPRPSSFE